MTLGIEGVRGGTGASPTLTQPSLSRNRLRRKRIHGTSEKKRKAGNG